MISNAPPGEMVFHRRHRAYQLGSPEQGGRVGVHAPHEAGQVGDRGADVHPLPVEGCELGQVHPQHQGVVLCLRAEGGRVGTKQELVLSLGTPVVMTERFTGFTAERASDDHSRG